MIKTVLCHNVRKWWVLAKLVTYVHTCHIKPLQVHICMHRMVGDSCKTSLSDTVQTSSKN